MKYALLGNPNTGKSSIFNMLTGLRQHVGNFPGVTVDKRTGAFTMDGEEHVLIDFPGTYSIYPRSRDERVVYRNLTDKTAQDAPNAVMVVVDASNIERNLLLFSQVYDLQLPILMVLNMTDLARKNGVSYDLEALQSAFPEARIVETNARINSGKERVLEALKSLPVRNGHRLFQEHGLLEMEDLKTQEHETKLRLDLIQQVVLKTVQKKNPAPPFSEKLDKILVHPVWGYAIFAFVLLIIFQFIYSFASIPMDLIDGGFASLSGWMGGVLPEGTFSDLLTQGIIPGIGGVVIFIPQIALLFFFIAILEESGYLSRVVFIMDRLMRPLGLNGKSVVPLMSSVACAIPGVMSARTIADWKERTITILVAPLMSCSARIPVYTLLIALVIPNKSFLGIVNLQGLVLFGLYALGVLSALAMAWIFKRLIKTREKGFLLLEMPSYKSPRWGNVALTVLEKVKVFVWDAGKVIMAISVVLWALATYGPSEKMRRAEISAKKEARALELSSDETDQLIAARKLEQSYIGILGHGIEPVIRPLGYDWKIGISLITSFAAREVFVGSMATIYAVQGDGEETAPLMEQMRAERRSDGTKVYSLASGVSLMVFYVFAMQCMSTLAVVKRETKSWKWPLLQVGYMGVLAYLGAWISFQLLA